MANKRGAHTRGAGNQGGYANSGYQGDSNQQSSSERAAYEQAYRQYVNQQAAARANQRGSHMAAGGQQQAPYQQQRVSAQRPASYASYGAAGQYSPYNGQNWNAAPKKKGHPVRNTIIVLLVIVVLIGAFAGFTGFTLYNSAKTVRADASAVLTDISDLKNQILNEQGDAAKATAADISKRAENMTKETSGWSWKIASYVPVYGSDVNSVRELSNVLEELSAKAVTPLVDEASQVSIKNMIGSDGSINVEQAQRLVSTLDNVAPVITACADKIDKLPEAHLEQISGRLEKAKTQVARLDKVTRFVDQIAPTFSDMLGANGQPRTYLIVAQSNSEIRSTGGFPGSVGPLYMSNGKIELGDFRSIVELYPNYEGKNEAGSRVFGSYALNTETLGGQLTDEEVNLFGYRLVAFLCDANFIPDWSRASQLFAYAWENKGYGHVDGVVGIDPVFLQDLMALSNTSITAPNGTVVDGTNAARLLLHDAYYLPTEEQDPFFEAVAAQSFQAFMGNIGNVSMMSLASAINKEADNRRFMVWMANADEEAAMETLGFDAKLPHDETAPAVGFYVDDESYSKIFWYLKIDSEIGQGVKNSDGSTTYPVRVTWTNMLPSESELSQYMQTHNKYRRSDGDMIEGVYLSAPAGGFISDVRTEGYFVPGDIDVREDDGAKHGDGMLESSLQGIDIWYGLAQTLPGESNSLVFNVTTSAKATEPLKFIRTATAQEVAGW